MSNDATAIVLVMTAVFVLVGLIYGAMACWWTLAFMALASAVGIVVLCASSYAFNVVSSRDHTESMFRQAAASAAETRARVADAEVKAAAYCK